MSTAAALHGVGALSAAFPVQLFTVTQSLVETVSAAVSGNTPVFSPINTGTVTITPMRAEIDAAPPNATLLLQPVQGIFNTSGQLCSADGAVGVQLVANINLNIGDTPLVYRVDYAGTPVAVNSFWFKAPTTVGQTVDLSQVTRTHTYAIDNAGAS